MNIGRGALRAKFRQICVLPCLDVHLRRHGKIDVNKALQTPYQLDPYLLELPYICPADMLPQQIWG